MEDKENNYNKKKYLKLLSKEYKNIYEVAEEIINLQAILNLPKGTEMFLSDIHGEYAPFEHILNNGGGIIKSKINDIFGNTISKKERTTLATLNFISLLIAQAFCVYSSQTYSIF